MLQHILTKMKKRFTGQTFAHIAVEFGELEDVRLLVGTQTVDWNEKSAKEDPAIIWALNKGLFEKVKALLKCPAIDLKIRDRNNSTLEEIARY